MRGFQAKRAACAKRPSHNKREAMPYSVRPSDDYKGHSDSPGVDEGTLPSVLFFFPLGHRVSVLECT